MKSRRALTVSLVCGVLIGILTWLYFYNMDEKYKNRAKLTPVLVARNYISQGTVLKDRMVFVAKVPNEYVQPGTINSIRDLVDERGQFIYTTQVPLLEGEQVSKTKLLSRGMESGLALAIPTGKTAVSVSVDEVKGLSGMIKPGNFVNILATLDYNEGKKSVSSTVTLFQNVQVIAVGKKMIGAVTVQPPQAGKGIRAVAAPAESPIITVALTPIESAILTYVREKGSISFTVRPYGDTITKELPNVGLNTVIPGAESSASILPKSGVNSVIENFQKQSQQILETIRQRGAE